MLWSNMAFRDIIECRAQGKDLCLPVGVTGIDSRHKGFSTLNREAILYDIPIGSKDSSSEIA